MDAALDALDECECPVLLATYNGESGFAHLHVRSCAVLRRVKRNGGR
jgi:hypothetical protein